MEVRIKSAFGHELLVSATVEDKGDYTEVTLPIDHIPGDPFAPAFMHIEVHNKKEMEALNKEIEAHRIERGYSQGYYGEVELDYVALNGNYIRCHYTFKEGRGRRMCVGEIYNVYENHLPSSIRHNGTSNEFFKDGTGHAYYYALVPIESRICW